MREAPLSAEQIDVEDVYQAIELYYERGWTDGLPVVPPTEKRVRAFLDAAGLAPDDVLGEIPERDRVLRAELLAINAVMAGCRPEYMPILVAATEAITDPAFKFNHMASLGSPWPVFVVNGPMARTLGFNSGLYLFGPTTRANATTSRAVAVPRLVSASECLVDNVAAACGPGNPLPKPACSTSHAAASLIPSGAGKCGTGPSLWPCSRSKSACDTTGLVKNEPTLHVSWSAASSTMPLRLRSPSTASRTRLGSVRSPSCAPSSVLSSR